MRLNNSHDADGHATNLDGLQGICHGNIVTENTTPVQGQDIFISHLVGCWTRPPPVPSASPRASAATLQCSVATPALRQNTAIVCISYRSFCLPLAPYVCRTLHASSLSGKRRTSQPSGGYAWHHHHSRAPTLPLSALLPVRAPTWSRVMWRSTFLAISSALLNRTFPVLNVRRAFRNRYILWPSARCFASPLRPHTCTICQCGGIVEQRQRFSSKSHILSHNQAAVPCATHTQLFANGGAREAHSTPYNSAAGQAPTGVDTRRSCVVRTCSL